MLEPNDFFQNQVKQCRSQAESAANKRDREFWLQLAGPEAGPLSFCSAARDRYQCVVD
jgi:hypothetical protein